jgi:glycosyltransferase involved in cell wall biosynthesis
MKPLVSIAVPTYNPTDGHLRSLVESVLKQDHRPLELVMCDDASGADLGWVNAVKEPEVTIIQAANDQRAGMVGNWNSVVERSSGDYVIVLHQDDLLVPTSVELLVDALTSDSSVVAAGCAPTFIDEEGKVLERRLRVNHRSRIFLSQKRYRLDRQRLTYLSLRNGQALGEPSAVMFRRDAFLSVKGYAEYQHAADVDFTLRLVSLGDVIYVNEPLFLRRWHGSNLTHHNRASGHVAKDRRMLYRRYADRLAKQDRNKVRAAMISYAFFDARTAAQFHDVRGVAGAFGPADIWLASPRAVFNRIRELATGNNLDQC